jgi:ankyrin repeat protein
MNGSSSSSSPTKPAKLLHGACNRGDLEAVKTLLYDGFVVNWEDHWGQTALLLASENNHVEIVESLLDSGAQIDHGDRDRTTALMWACLNGNIDCARLLLDRGADMSLEDKFGRTAKDISKEHDDLVQLLNEVCYFSKS